MTVDFFVGQEIEYSSEQSSFYRLAKYLHEKYQNSPTYFALIANIDNPQAALPQLDALLLCENFIALIDFKNCGDPLHIPNAENARWYAKPAHGGKYPVKSGNQKNPRIQARNAHYAWSTYLQKQTAPILANPNLDWNQLKGWVLFEPRLHPNNHIPLTKKDHLWLNFSDISHVDTLISGAKTKLNFTPTEIKKLAKSVFNAHPWLEFDRLFTKILGYIKIVGEKTNYPIHSFDKLTIGRSGSCDIKIPSDYIHVSGHHARIETGLQAVRLYDDESKHGTHIGDTAIDNIGGKLLSHNIEITLGKITQSPPCKLQYQSQNSNNNLGSRTNPTAL